LCRAETGEDVFRKPTSTQVANAAFSHAGAHLAYGGDSGEITLLDTAQWQPLMTLSCGNPITCLAFTPDDWILASGHTDGTVRLWDTQTGRLRTKLVGHERGVRSMAFSPDGHTLLSSAVDSSVRIWSVDHARAYGVAYRHSDAAMNTRCAVSLSSNGRRLAVGYSSELKDLPDVLLWDLPPSRRNLPATVATSIYDQ
jgi:hypothetical protein